MAARRLVILMIVLLIASSIAAALAPTPPRDDAETSTTTPATPAAPTQLGPGATGPGELVRARVAVGEKPERVRVNAGDQLDLTVTWDEVATLEITEIGESADVGPGSPADFDLLLKEPGRHRIVPLDDPDRTLATIIVRDANAASDPKDEKTRSRARQSAGDRGS